MAHEANGKAVAFRKVLLHLKDGPRKGPVVLPDFEQQSVWISKLRIWQSLCSYTRISLRRITKILKWQSRKLQRNWVLDDAIKLQN